MLYNITMVVCAICNNKFENYNSLAKHIYFNHKDFDKETYYLKYINPNIDVKCPYCDNKKTFKNINLGYTNTCSDSECCKKYKKDNNLYSFSKKEVRSKSKLTCIEKYGVDNPFKSDVVKEKIKETKKDIDISVINEKRKATNLTKYGSENFVNSDKRKKTNLDKYGSESYLGTDECIEKSKQTKLDRYNNENYNNISKSKLTCIEKYGVDNYSKTNEYKNFIKDYWSNISDEVLNDIINKKENTNIEKFGKEYYTQTDDYKNFIVDYWSNISDEVLNDIISKQKSTLLNKYGVDNYSKTDEFKSKLKDYRNKLSNEERQLISDKISIKVKDYLNSLSEEEIKEKNHKLKLNYYNTLLLIPNIKPLFTFEDYIGVKVKKYKFLCLKCNREFEFNLGDGRIPYCKRCNYKYKFRSNIEKEILDWLRTYNLYIENNKKFNINNKKYEIDIYLEDFKLGIEVDGLYWHSEKRGCDRNYHLNKTNFFKDLGITIIHIFDNEWIYKQDIVKSMILSKLGLITTRLYARNCEIRLVDNITSKEFLNKSHIQGSINSIINIGLYNNDELVMICNFSKSRFSSKYDYELYRFATKLYTTVVGGFSKILKYFIDRYLKSGNLNKTLITYCDKRFSIGNVYIKNGFKLINESSPNYFYTRDYKTLSSRIQFQKHKLVNILDNYNEALSEWENMLVNNYDRIWDCGNLVYIYSYGE